MKVKHNYLHYSFLEQVHLCFIKYYPHMLSRIIITYLIFSVSLFAQGKDSELKSDVDKILNENFFQHSQIALDVYNLTKDKPLYSRNSSLLFHPASNMKLFTSAAALLFLPQDFEFTTSVYHTGVIEGNTLYGDLYITGGLDPAFSSNDLDSLVTNIRLSGIKNITDNIYADVSVKDSLYWGRGWMWDDDPDPTAPYLSALNIDDNSLEVLVEAEKTDSTAKVILTPQTDYVSVENNSTVSSYLPTKLQITRSWVDRKNHIIIDGVVKAGGIIDSSDNKVKLNILNPEKYFLTMLKEKLNARGISFDGNIAVAKLPPQSTFITSFSHSIDSVLLSAINKDSDNLRAEMLLYALALNDSGVPAAAKNGIEAINKLVDKIGFSRDDYSFADGSGVSRYNLVSSELIIGVLKFMYRQKQFEFYHNSLSVAGVDGTLKTRLIGTEAEKNLHAKSGTLAGVSALSGYITAKNGDLLAFSILMQNFVKKMIVARSIQDRICKLLAGYE